jgi:LacI family transcriptional regulator
VTIYDVASRAGVSSATVSRVFGEARHVAEATRELVLATARDLGYRPNALARSLSRRETDTLAILLPDITNPFFPSLVGELQTEAEKAGFTVLLCNTRDDADAERRYLDMLLSKQVRHVFIIGMHIERAMLQEYADGGLTFIALDRAIPRSVGFLVRSDNRGGAALAVRHLLDLGHTRIAHIKGPVGVDVSEDRYAGYVDALTAAGVPTDPDLVIPSDTFSEESGSLALGELLARETEFSAIFAANDLIAIGAMFAAHERGMQLPDDFSLVGFDDVALARYTTPQLSTVRQDVAAMARAAVEVITADPPKPRRRTTTLPVSLEVRGSTSRRAPRGGRRKLWSA